LDFQEIKSGFSFEDAIAYLGLNMTRAGEQFRGACPSCKTGGPRGLVVTPGKGYFCFGAKKGGDQVALVAHIKNIGQREAGALLEERYRTGTSTSTSSLPKSGAAERNPPATIGLKAIPRLEYLEPGHEAVQALGITSVTAEAFEAGFATKGVLRGRFAVPIKALDSTIIAYAGIAVKDDQQPRLLFNHFDPTKYLFNLDRVRSDDTLYVARDPIDVLLAFEQGAENVVSFLSPITPDALQVLSLVMEERGVAEVELL
jgi:DNA primase